MKKLLSTVGVAAALFAFSTAAHATLVATDSSFFTVNTAGTLTFTFEGFSAGDTDEMKFVFNGVTIFDNKTAAVGSTYSVAVAAGTYKLSLSNITKGTTYSSDPALNTDGAHLASTTTWTDFGLGATAPVPGAIYYGWEDRPLKDAKTLDYNDLVFKEVFTSSKSVPEPATLALLGAGLIGLGAVRRRKTA